MRSFLFFLCLIASTTTLAASTPLDTNQLITHFKVEDGKVLLRWNPTQPEQWSQGRKNGYIIEKYVYPKNGGKPSLAFKSETPILPVPYSDWIDRAGNNESSIGVRDLVHYEKMDAVSLEEDLPLAEYGESGRKNVFHQLSNYFMHRDFTLIEAAGLGFKDEEVAADGKYLYTIKLVNQPAVTVARIIVDVANYKDPVVPTLKAEFKPKGVELQWRTKEFNTIYYGYFLEKSEDGIHFTVINEAPIINLFDTSSTAALQSAYFTDSLAQNDKTYWYRLRGADFLGGWSENHSEVSGMGYEEIPFSPMIEEAIQTDSNYAVIKWKFPAGFDEHIQEFQIFHADSLGGIYAPVMVGIDKKLRTISVRMRYNTNSYRVVLVPHNGPKKASFPALVMAWDEEPPAMPIGFTGTIDTLGVVQLNWEPNTEIDLDGYKVYKSYHKDTEFSGITPKPIQLTNFTDTVDMVVGNEWVYYTIQAVDERNNRSEFTAILELKKKDMYAPVEPHIHHIEKSTGKIEVQWYNSSSPDVETHRLFRKILGEEESWTLLEEYDLIDATESYTDTNVVRNKIYAYTLIAIDDDGLESEPAQAATAKLIDYGLRAPIKITEVKVTNEEKKVAISWDYPLNASEFWIYKGTDKEKTSLMKVVTADDKILIDENLKAGTAYHYYLKAFFEDGSFSPFTEKIEVSLDD